MFGKFGCSSIQNVNWNTSQNYIGSVKTFLEKCLKKVTKKFMEKAKENGERLVNSSDSLDKKDLIMLCDALLNGEKHVERLLLIMQFQAIGRISEVMCASFQDLSWH